MRLGQGIHLVINAVSASLARSSEQTPRRPAQAGMAPSEFEQRMFEYARDHDFRPHEIANEVLWLRGQ